MTTKFYTIAGLILLTAGGPVLAGDNGDSGTQATTKSDANDPNKVVCHRIESIGTRLGSKRVCRTKGEWDAERAAERQTLERTQTQRYGKDNT